MFVFEFKRHGQVCELTKILRLLDLIEVDNNSLLCDGPIFLGDHFIKSENTVADHGDPNQNGQDCSWDGLELLRTFVV